MLTISFASEALEVFGKVYGNNQLPLENVVVSSEKKAAISNAKGYFNLQNIEANEKIRFHKIGFKDTVFVAKQLPRKVILEEKSIEIAGINIVGKRENRGIFSSINKMVIPVSETENMAENAADILKNNANLNLKGINLSGEKQTISLNGNLTRHTIVMLDGIPLNSSGGEFDISTIPAEIIERIEVIQGGGSFVGSGAIGGVVNIVTKETAINREYQKNIDFSVTHSAGSFGYSRTNFSFKVTKTNLRISTFISSAFARNNFKYKYTLSDSVEWKERENNQKLSGDFNLRINHQNKYLNWKYNLLFRNFHKGLPGPINSLNMNDKARLDGKTARNFLELSKKIKSVFLNSDFYFFNETTRFENTESSLPYYNIIGNTKYEKKGGKLTADYGIKEFFDSQSGIEFRREDFEYECETSQTASIAPVFLQDSAIFTAFNFYQKLYPFRFEEDFSVRFDHPFRSDEVQFNDFLSWKTEGYAEFQGLISIRIGGGIGNSFSLPSFYDLYWKGDSNAVGNPYLKPEIGQNKYAFLHFVSSNNDVKIEFLRNKIEDLIYWHRSVNSWKPDNIAAAEISNLIFSGEINPFFFWKTGWQINLTKALDKTLNEDGSASNTFNRPLIYTPDKKIVAFTSFSLNDFYLKISYTKIGKQRTSRYNDNKMLAAYELVDTQFAFEKKLGNFDMKFYIQLNNVFDEHYEIYLLSPRPGFNWKTGISLETKL